MSNWCPEEVESAFADPPLGPDHPWHARQVGLCMVVRDAADLLERTLPAVRPFVDHWLIVDTGSTDGTLQLVRDLMADVPGRLIQRRSAGYAQDRTDALAAARRSARYTLVLEAGDELQAEPGFVWPVLSADSVVIACREADRVSWQCRLVANTQSWRNVSATSLDLDARGEPSRTTIEGLSINAIGWFASDEAPRDGERLRAEIVALHEALDRQPENNRLYHELAAAYRAASDVPAALSAYRRAAIREDYPARAADALHGIARLLEQRGADDDDVVLAYLRAWERHPASAESLVELARFSREKGRFPLGLLAAHASLPIPMPQADTWTDPAVYGWRRLDEFAAANFMTGRMVQCAEACRALLDGDDLPSEFRERVETNMRVALERAGRRLDADSDRTDTVAAVPAQ